MNSAVYIGGVLGGQNQQVDPQRPLIHLTVGPATLRIEGKMTQRQMSMLADFVKDIRYSDVCVLKEVEERRMEATSFTVDPSKREEQQAPVDLEHPTISADDPTVFPQF